MGLDQYAFATLAEKIGDAVVDFPHSFGISKYDINAQPAIQLAYWRKHPNLHGWMQRLYLAKGGKPPREDGMGGGYCFNGDAVLLTIEDIEQLAKDVEAEALPPTSGFFFGQSQPEDRRTDEEFIEAARNALALGLAVYYTSSW